MKEKAAQLHHWKPFVEFVYVAHLKYVSPCPRVTREKISLETFKVTYKVT